MKRRLAWTALALSFSAGATDAFAFLLLGGVFTANMTGNLVLAGLTQRPGYPSMIVWIAVAIVVFVGVLYLTFRWTRTRTRRTLVIALVAGIAAQIVVLIGWIVLPHPLGLGLTAALLAPSALAMAVQTAISKRVENSSGVTTTYVTGTITSIAADLADRNPQDLFTRCGVLIALVGGALSASLLMNVSSVAAAALPAVPAVVGLALLLSVPASAYTLHPSVAGAATKGPGSTGAQA